MSDSRTLHGRIAETIAAHASRVAVIDAADGTSLTYQELGDAAGEVAGALDRAGVAAGDRVGLCVPKSVHSVVGLLGILRAGAAYVPVDSGSPVARNAFIFQDCAVQCVIATADTAQSLGEQGSFKKLEHLAGGHVLLQRCASDGEERVTSDGLAYVLYTSGSTGMPKGVMLSHSNALSFVEWCIHEFSPTPEDRFSSHAPFHFDLSILDLYVPLLSGAAIIVLNEALGKNPAALSETIEAYRITCWYSTPSILRLLVELGKLEQRDCSSLRLINFAGEVFPIKYLRALKELLPDPVYYNLYGPTETNVCTYYRIPEVMAEERTDPFPIGYCCDNDRARVVDSKGADVAAGEEGELVIQGGTVMQGYWNLPERTRDAFFEGGSSADRWYRTGDVVRELSSAPGCFDYVGRRDRMVKRRGYRVELGEIEAALVRYPGMREAAAVAIPDEPEGLLVRVFLAWTESEGKAPGTIKLKAYSAKNLPAYMIPDRFSYLQELPKTSTDKMDYQKLIALASES